MLFKPNATQQEEMYSEAVNYYYGRNGYSKNYAKAFDLFRQLYSCKHPGATNMLGVYYQDGHGTEVDMNKAAQYYVTAAELGNYNGFFNLGARYYFGDSYLGQDYGKAFSLFNKALPSGYGYVYNQIANCYYYGRGVEKNYEEAVRYYRKAAEVNYTLSIFNLGVMYYYGTGVNVDYMEADRLFKKAEANGYTKAREYIKCTTEKLALSQDNSNDIQILEKEFNRAINYFVGNEDTIIDFAAGMRTLNRLKNKRYAPAELILGIIYLEGLFNESPSRDNAIENLRCAVVDGLSNDVDELMNEYWQGAGMPKDLAKARLICNVLLEKTSRSSYYRNVLQKLS